jgi:hypothetical protein
MLPKGQTESVCGYEDGPFIYKCNSGCCSRDCSAFRGELTDKKVVTQIETFDTFRTDLRKKLFGDIPDGPLILIFILVVIILLALANMLKAKGRKFGR